MVQASQPKYLDLPETADEGAVERFIRKHGREALPLYRKVIEQYRHTTDYVQALELAAAVEGFAAVEGASSVPVLRALALDVSVPPDAVAEALKQIEKVSSQEEALRVMGEKLLIEGNLEFRYEVMYRMLRTGNPGAIPFLKRAWEQEQDKSLRAGMERAIRLLEKPGVCQLTTKNSWVRKDGLKEWQCNYRCPGAQSATSIAFREDCPETVPLPRRRSEDRR